MWLYTLTLDDGLCRADGGTRTAVGAFVWIYPAQTIFLADSLDWTLGLASAAIYARIGYLVCHNTISSEN